MVAGHVCEYIIDRHYTLLMMGIPVDGPTWAFGDNASVITYSTIPQFTLHKRHNVLSYHSFCECNAYKILYLVHGDRTCLEQMILLLHFPILSFFLLIQKNKALR